MPGSTPRGRDARATTAPESSTMRGGGDPPSWEEKGFKMRMFWLLCAGLILLGAVGCSGQSRDVPTSTDPVAEVPVETEAAPGEDRLKGLFTYMADAALFLLSDEASWITGHILNVDGGQLMRP